MHRCCRILTPALLLLSCCCCCSLEGVNLRLLTLQLFIGILLACKELLQETLKRPKGECGNHRYGLDL